MIIDKQRNEKEVKTASNQRKKDKQENLIRQKGQIQGLILNQKQNSQKNNSDYNQSNINHRIQRSSSKITQNPFSTLDQINQTQKQLNGLINQLDTRLKHNYQLKQQRLIQSYRQQLIKAHKDLVQLKNNTNQQQIKNQMNQKALQLKKQRLQLIQVNMFYSNKCLQYKKLLDQKLNQANQLERQLKFLTNQINNSHKKRIQLMGELYDQNSPIKNKNNQLENQSDKFSLRVSQQDIAVPNKSRQITQLKQKRSILSTHANTQTMRKNIINSNSKQKVIKKQKDIINSHAKKLFEEKLNGIKQSQIKDQFHTQSKNTNLLSKLSNVNKVSKISNNQKSYTLQSAKQNDQQSVNSTRNSQIQNLFMKAVQQIQNKKQNKKQIALFKGQMFTDVQKKQIMKCFLSDEQVKQYIYNIIFDKVDNSQIFKKKQKQKVKIITNKIDQNSNRQNLAQENGF